MSLLHDLNDRYIALHQAKEDAFWVNMMGLDGDAPDGFDEKEIALKRFSSDPKNLARVRAELARDGLSEQERTGLAGWERFFAVNAIENEEAQECFAHLVELESALDRARRAMPLGYADPATGAHVRAGANKLPLMMATEDDEALRKAAWEGLRSIEPYVLERGFIEVVRERNRLAHLLGYEDYYDYKVTINEGFSKAKLFELLDDLERDTRDAAKRSLRELIDEHGPGAEQPWNYSYFTSGGVTREVDPYFPFAEAIARWGRSFAALEIEYNGATLQLDLVDRSGKYENGFMHGPFPGYIEDGRYHPARINFTANAVPGQVGSGERAMQTLFHEGGHAAHFANIMMPAPVFSQEFAPTSVAFAETQSMFLDSLLGDADWLTRYAKSEAGESMPMELIQRLLEKNHRTRAMALRRMLSVSYAEKRLYEMADDELTAENILAMIRDVEQSLLFQPAGSRPILSIPHLLAGESSAYYHGYTLAQMAVFQTRRYFLETDGHIMDNPRVGVKLRDVYWRPGNSKTFLEFVEELTGKPFSAEATVDLVNRTLEEVFTDAERMVERSHEVPEFTGEIDLDATIRIVHGREVIGSSDDGGFDRMAREFADWIEREEERRAAG